MPFAVTHTLGHAMASIHVPAEVQSCWVDPLHLVVVGAQTPRHAAAPDVVSQTPGHGIVSHEPPASHICKVRLSLHLVWLGSHTPVHPLVLHTDGQVAVGIHAPAMHVCRTLPLHCVVPLVHDVPHCPPLQMEGVQGAPMLPQIPLRSQLCGCAPLHCLSFGTQVPAQTLLKHK
jgi:hypothetical protein